jgi:hypothetical protein
MTLGNMREQGVHHVIGFYLNDACRHHALISLRKGLWPTSHRHR